MLSPEVFSKERTVLEWLRTVDAMPIFADSMNQKFVISPCCPSRKRGDAIRTFREGANVWFQICENMSSTVN